MLNGGLEAAGRSAWPEPKLRFDRRKINQSYAVRGKRMAARCVISLSCRIELLRPFPVISGQQATCETCRINLSCLMIGTMDYTRSLRLRSLPAQRIMRSRATKVMVQFVSAKSKIELNSQYNRPIETANVSIKDLRKETFQNKPFLSTFRLVPESCQSAMTLMFSKITPVSTA